MCKSRTVMHNKKTVLADGHKVAHGGFEQCWFVRVMCGLHGSVFPAEPGFFCIQVIV